MNNETASREAEQAAAAAEHAPGGIPATGGVPPQNGAPALSNSTDERAAAEDLADGIDLMLRAARKSLRALDPRIEQAAERALTRLQQLDEGATAALKQRAGLDAKKVEGLAAEMGREIAAVVERVSARVESVLGKR
ncbi:MAG TPA: hypothetical protein VER33_22395 [Polyangiaceae bacterium]|nr:hypothetical protein [Polyangiaceae bacterium]